MASVLTAVEHDLGGLFVKRLLPNKEKKMVGPFIFFDQMGPSEFPAGKGINVRPHPHSGLTTLTYLFDGAILHRDSLGNHLEITPGDVNWMTAGKGIVHSERETLEVRVNKHSISGLQCWVALPQDKAEIEPSFAHVKKQDLPHSIYEGVMMRLIVGEAYGMCSPVKTYSPMFYIDVVAAEGSNLEKPHATHETAIFIVSGRVTVKNICYQQGEFILLDNDDRDIHVEQDSRFIVLGGQQFDDTPFIDWNFVSFSKERIAKARSDWKQGLFPSVPGDNKEYIPL